MRIALTVLAVALLTPASLSLSQPSPAPTTRRAPQFENTRVRVWKSFIEPNQPLSMHRHEQGRTLVALVGGTVKIQNQAGVSKTVTWETGKAYWLDADPPGEMHIDVNESGKTIEVMIVEMK